MRRAVIGAMLVGSCVAGASGSSRGDDPAAAQHEAQSRFGEGLARVQAGNFEGARISFTQAYAVLHKPDILWNLALAEEKCGMALPALQHFKDYARQVTDGAARAAAAKHMQELGEKTGRIDIVAPAGATVAVDGVAVGEAPLGEPVDVEPGHHRVVERSSGVSKSADSDVAPGQLVHVSFVMIEAEAPPGPPGPSAVVVPAPASIAPGAHGTPAAGEDLPPPTNPAGGFWTPRVIVAGLLGVAAVAAGVSALVLGHQSDVNANAARSLQATTGSCPGSPGCAQLEDKVDAQHQDHVASEIVWTASGVLLAGAVVTWIAWPRALSSAAGDPGFRVVPSVGVNGAGALVSGTF